MDVGSKLVESRSPDYVVIMVSNISRVWSLIAAADAGGGAAAVRRGEVLFEGFSAARSHILMPYFIRTIVSKCQGKHKG